MHHVDLQSSNSYRTWKGWDQECFGVLSRSTECYFKAEIELCIGSDLGKMEVLEIGFGNGQFAQYCRIRGWGYTGVETNPELVEVAREAGYDAHAYTRELGALGSQQFDVVALFDVLEHLSLDEAANMLVQLRRSLKHGGRILARFPSGDSPFSLAMQNSDATHRSHIGTGVVEQLCAASGFAALQIRGPAYPVFGQGLRTASKRLAIKVIRKITFPVLRLLFMDGKKRVLDGNMVVVLESTVSEIGE